MKFVLAKVILSVCFGFCLVSTAVAADPWTKGDKIRQGVMLSLMTVDWLQTKEAMRQYPRYKEGNPILGEHPSQDSIDCYFLCTVVLKTLLAHFLPNGPTSDREYRQLWHGFNIFMSAYAVGGNYTVGVRILF